VPVAGRIDLTAAWRRKRKANLFIISGFLPHGQTPTGATYTGPSPRAMSSQSKPYRKQVFIKSLAIHYSILIDNPAQ
jgi:hypothetical protein